LPVKVRLAQTEDADTIEPHLREADRAELVAASGPDVLGQLREAVELSRGRLGRMAFVAEHDGDIVALFGFVPTGHLSSTAHPWLVGTPGLARVPGMLNRLSRSYCSAVLGEYPLLVNYVDARNVTSAMWLKRLGFKLDAAQPFGVEGLPFHRFEMRGPLV
jgi:hypothetical protein